MAGPLPKNELVTLPRMMACVNVPKCPPSTCTGPWPGAAHISMLAIDDGKSLDLQIKIAEPVLSTRFDNATSRRDSYPPAQRHCDRRIGQGGANCVDLLHVPLDNPPALGIERAYILHQVANAMRIGDGNFARPSRRTFSSVSRTKCVGPRSVSTSHWLGSVFPDTRTIR